MVSPESGQTDHVSGSFAGLTTGCKWIADKTLGTRANGTVVSSLALSLLAAGITARVSALEVVASLICGTFAVAFTFTSIARD